MQRTKQTAAQVEGDMKDRGTSAGGGQERGRGHRQGIGGGVWTTELGLTGRLPVITLTCNVPCK